MNKRNLRDVLASILFLLAFVFVGSGMFEACVLKLLDILGW